MHIITHKYEIFRKKSIAIFNGAYLYEEEENKKIVYLCNLFAFLIP